jgi:iron complex transport system permease protein
MIRNFKVLDKMRKIFNQDDPNMKVIIFLLLLGSVTSILLAIGIGSTSIHPVIVTKVIFSKLPFLSDSVIYNFTKLDENIVWGLRLPRVLLGMLVGASLSVTGVTMQALVRNHLADPFILGVSSGASAMATLGMLYRE